MMRIPPTHDSRYKKNNQVNFSGKICLESRFPAAPKSNQIERARLKRNSFPEKTANISRIKITWATEEKRPLAPLYHWASFFLKRLIIIRLVNYSEKCSAV
jgi:hypothetical protein